MKKLLLLCVLCAVLCASVACVRWPRTFMENGVYKTTNGQMTVYQDTAGVAFGTRLLPDGTTEEIYLLYYGREMAKIYRVADFYDGENYYRMPYEATPLFKGECEVYDDEKGLVIWVANGEELHFERIGDIPEDYESPIPHTPEIPTSNTTT